MPFFFGFENKKSKEKVGHRSHGVHRGKSWRRKAIGSFCIKIVIKKGIKSVTDY